MASEKLVVNGALVLCSWTKLPTGDKMGNIENYKIYRIVTVGETNNGIFGLDDAFLTEKDAGPYLRLDPFPVCQSPNYARALYDISSYLVDLADKSDDVNEKELINLRRELLSSLAARAQDYQDIPRENRQNLCLLELLDHWFNCSTTLYIDNYMQKLEALIDSWDIKTEEIKVKVDTIKSAVEKKTEKKYTMQEFGSAKQENASQTLSERQEDLERAVKEGEITRKVNAITNFLNEYTTFCEDMKEKLSEAVYRLQLDGSDKYVDQNSDQLTEKGDALTGLVDDEVKRLDDTMIRGLIQEYQLTEEYQKLYDYIKSIKSEFAPLLEVAETLKNDLNSQAVVTENSYLMCRCGGKINIIDGGQWVDKVDFKVKEDIENVLLYAEETIYGFLKEKGTYLDAPITEDCVDTRFSVIIALNGIHALLNSMDIAGKYSNIPDSDYVKLLYPLPNIKIDLTPQNEVEDMANKDAVLREAYTHLPKYFKEIFMVLFYVVDISNMYSTEETNTMNEVFLGIFNDLTDAAKDKAKESDSAAGKTIESIEESDFGKTASVVESGQKWYELLHDLMTKSYALFIGEIKIE